MLHWISKCLISLEVALEGSVICMLNALSGVSGLKEDSGKQRFSGEQLRNVILHCMINRFSYVKHFP